MIKWGLNFGLYLTILLSHSLPVWAGIEGAVSGTIVDGDGAAVANASVQILSASEQRILGRATSAINGDFRVFPLTVGNYVLKVEVPGFATYTADVQVASSGETRANIRLSPAQEMVLEVKAKRRMVQTTESVSRTEVTGDQIRYLPQGNEISLPKLLTTTTPGVVQGAFNQMFFRGNHGNIQYQIDGVQLPESPSGTFGEAFSPRNIDHMEVITGGIPAEYGQRLGTVVNIVTKSGPEKPGGEMELNYGTYDTFSPHLLYGGSNESGAVHYFVSANFQQTSRGLETPQPKSPTEQTQGGTESVHNHATGHNEFAKVDWYANNRDKVALVFFNSENRHEIPNYPSSFRSNDAFFQPGFVDHFGNGGGSDPTFIYTPSDTNDRQHEVNLYGEAIWKHTFDNNSFLQVAPYYKYGLIHFQNDPAKDLFTMASNATTFYENRKINTYGLKADYTMRIGEDHLVKAGTQVQTSRSTGMASVQTGTMTQPSVESNPQSGQLESIYVQDDYTITKKWILNAGVRADFTQFKFADASPTDWLLQPRIGLNYLVTDSTKLHAFYGKLFQPAPVEDLRDTFVNTSTSACQPGQASLCPYDIKAEKDDYFEVGVAQQLGDRHVAELNAYYRDAKDMLDDTQLLNTAIAQPYNYQKGFAYGAEFSLKGDIDSRWSDYFNYAYSIAKGYGISGGIFAFPKGEAPAAEWKMLDHVQMHTANAGLTYHCGHFWWTTQGVYGSGLRTDPNNGTSLPAHITFDTTAGYELKGDSWWMPGKISADILNITDNVYPITVSNGYNGSHYAAGRQFFIRLTKEL